jgi:hypothetical protein
MDPGAKAHPLHAKRDVSATFVPLTTVDMTVGFKEKGGYLNPN